MSKEEIWTNQERAVIKYGELICGVDEAGRGPLAGPVCAAAVILPKGVVINGLDDSKKLSEKTRERLYREIISVSVYSICFADSKVIDDINILQATFDCMNRAVTALSEKPEIVFVDGNASPQFGIDTMCLVGGDSRLACISAASVLAKVSRDRLMLEYDKLYPQYGFARHKGYGTKEHYTAIREYGVSAVHRATFLKGIS